MKLSTELCQLFLTAEQSLDAGSFQEYMEKYNKLRQLVNQESETDMLALMRLVIEIKEKIGSH